MGIFGGHCTANHKDFLESWRWETRIKTDLASLSYKMCSIKLPFLALGGGWSKEHLM